MCGIVGYIGSKPVVPVIIEGLRRLEYRGYDSAGIAVAGGPSSNGNGLLELRRAPGKLRNLETVIADNPITGTFGIGHTRWATHARPTDAPRSPPPPRNTPLPRDGELAVLTREGVSLSDFKGHPLPLNVQRIAWD